MAQGTHSGVLYLPTEVGWGERWEGGRQMERWIERKQMWQKMIGRSQPKV